jgi:hypothetical protein
MAWRCCNGAAWKSQVTSFRVRAMLPRSLLGRAVSTSDLGLALAIRFILHVCLSCVHGGLCDVQSISAAERTSTLTSRSSNKHVQSSGRLLPELLQYHGNASVDLCRHEPTNLVHVYDTEKCEWRRTMTV